MESLKTEPKDEENQGNHAERGRGQDILAEVTHGEQLCVHRCPHLHNNLPNTRSYENKQTISPGLSL